jgi:hypothetical protein
MIGCFGCVEKKRECREERKREERREKKKKEERREEEEMRIGIRPREKGEEGVTGKVAAVLLLFEIQTKIPTKVKQKRIKIK